MSNIINLLLEGITVIKEIKENDIKYITWLETSLQDDLKPSYPFRTESYAMLGHSKYHNSCPIEKAKFKLRESSFLRSDIENEYDPSYEHVGSYFYLNSINDLTNYLSSKNIELNSFIEVSKVESYPL